MGRVYREVSFNTLLGENVGLEHSGYFVFPPFYEGNSLLIGAQRRSSSLFSFSLKSRAMKASRLDVLCAPTSISPWGPRLTGGVVVVELVVDDGHRRFRSPAHDSPMKTRPAAGIRRYLDVP